MLGRWLEWAKLPAWDDGSTNGSATPEYNARNILTLWGPTGQIRDYARREYGGLVRDFYGKRYQAFISAAAASLASQEPWDQDRFVASILSKVELPFCAATTKYPTVPESDAVSTARRLMKKYLL